MKILCFFPLLLLSFNSLAQLPVDSLVAYYPFNGNANDESVTGNNATVINATLSTNRFGGTDKSYAFNGINEYIEFPDHDSLSIATTGKFSISVWMRPDTLNFENTEGDGYVHWMGKGSSGEHEWLLRMYNLASTRPNRTSCYVFNLSGGLGSGSYVEETLTASTWIHLTAVYNFPANTINIYKNGVLRDTDYFTDYSVIPGNGTAPFRIGTRDFNSYFKGAIDDIRIYSRVLSAAEIMELYNEPDNVSSILTIQAGPLKIYPNPSEGFFIVDSGKESNNDFTLEIVNSLGQSIRLEQLNLQRQSIQLDEAEPGKTYLLRIFDNNLGTQYTQRIVIR